MKDKRDVKKEYGYTLRWINGYQADGITHPYRFWLECDFGGENIPIDDTSILEPLPKNKQGFEIYDAYVRLFEKLGIKPMDEKDRHMRFHKIISSSLSVRQLTNSDTANYYRKTAGIKVYKNVTNEINERIKKAQEIFKV